MIGFLLGLTVGLFAGRGGRKAKATALDRKKARDQGYELALDELVLRGHISARVRFDLLDELAELP